MRITGEAMPFIRAAMSFIHALSIGAPTLVYDATALHLYQYDALPDGSQIVIIRGAEETDEIRRVTVVLNFSKELTEKMKAAH